MVRGSWGKDLKDMAGEPVWSAMTAGR
jgi:hypothetical protein